MCLCWLAATSSSPITPLQEAQALGTFAFTARAETPGGGDAKGVAEGATLSHATGNMAVETYISMMDLGQRACQRLADFSRASLEQSFAANG